MYCTGRRGGGKGGGNKQEREEGRARTGWRAREGFAAVSLPPQLDPVVKAEREAGWVRLAAYGRRRESGRRGAEARRGEAGSKGREPSADLSSAPVVSQRCARLQREEDAQTSSDPSSE